MSHKQATSPETTSWPHQRRAALHAPPHSRRPLLLAPRSSTTSRRPHLPLPPDRRQTAKPDQSRRSGLSPSLPPPQQLQQPRRLPHPSRRSPAASLAAKSTPPRPTLTRARPCQASAAATHRRRHRNSRLSRRLAHRHAQPSQPRHRQRSSRAPSTRPPLRLLFLARLLAVALTITIRANVRVQPRRRRRRCRRRSIATRHRRPSAVACSRWPTRPARSTRRWAPSRRWSPRPVRHPSSNRSSAKCRRRVVHPTRLKCSSLQARRLLIDLPRPRIPFRLHARHAHRKSKPSVATRHHSTRLALLRPLLSLLVASLAVAVRSRGAPCLFVLMRIATVAPASNNKDKKKTTRQSHARHRLSLRLGAADSWRPTRWYVSSCLYAPPGARPGTDTVCVL